MDTDYESRKLLKKINQSLLRYMPEDIIFGPSVSVFLHR